jgi:hypothetical protein
MGLPLVVAILLLEGDEQAREYFTGKGEHDFKTLAGGSTLYFVPETITDLFDPEVQERYPKLNRAGMPFLHRSESGSL